MAPPSPDRLHEVQLDIYIARRKRMHAIFDPNGIPVFHAPLIMQVMEWLADKEITRVRFTDDDTAYEVTFQPCALEQPPTGE